MRGGEAGFIEERACLAWVHHALHGMVPRECHVALLSSTPAPTESSSIFARVPFSDPIFEGSFGGLLVLKMGHAAYRRKALDVYFPTV